MIHWVFQSARAAALWAMLLGLWTGCANGPHQAELTTLADLKDSLATAKSMLGQLDVDTLASTRAWASEELRAFEVMLSDSGMVLSKEEGLVIAEVSRARRLLKDFPDRIVRTDASIDRALNQISSFAHLLESKAPTDGAGHAVDSAYISDNLAQEVRIARALLASVEETTQYAERGSLTAAAVRTDADRLKTQLRARLAQLVIARSEDGANPTPR